MFSIVFCFCAMGCGVIWLVYEDKYDIARKMEKVGIVFLLSSISFACLSCITATIYAIL